MNNPKPTVAAKAPVAVAIEKDKNYAWCSCGLAAKQPFCDGAHKGKGFAPKVFKEASSRTVHLCQCKMTKNPPYCDGSHSGL